MTSARDTLTAGSSAGRLLHGGVRQQPGTRVSSIPQRSHFRLRCGKALGMMPSAKFSSKTLPKNWMYVYRPNAQVVSFTAITDIYVKLRHTLLILILLCRQPLWISQSLFVIGAPSQILLPTKPSDLDMYVAGGI